MPAIAEHGDRLVKNTGDGFVTEFASAVEPKAVVLIELC
jgi:class 3 adenylate cyclase